MELTNEIIEKHGFKRINNSMWRNGNITLQNGYTHEGNTIYEKLLNTKKAYKVCIKGKYALMATTEECIIELVRGQKADARHSNCTIHGVSGCASEKTEQQIDDEFDWLINEGGYGF